MLHACEGGRPRSPGARRYGAALGGVSHRRLATRARRPRTARAGAAELAVTPRALRRGSRAGLPAAERAGNGGTAPAARRGRAPRRLHGRARGARPRRARPSRRHPPDRGARGGSGRARAPARAPAGRAGGTVAGRTTLVGMEHGELNDRRLEALLERLDRIADQLERFNRRQESREELTVIAHELRNLNESLQALAYAALGREGPQVRRRRTG